MWNCFFILNKFEKWVKVTTFFTVINLCAGNNEIPDDFSTVATPILLAFIKEGKIEWNSTDAHGKIALNAIIKSGADHEIERLFEIYLDKKLKILCDSDEGLDDIVSEVQYDIKKRDIFFDMVFFTIHKQGETLFGYYLKNYNYHVIETIFRYFKVIEKENNNKDKIIQRVNFQDLFGNTPLHYACLRTHTRIEELIKLGADPFLRNNKNQYPVQCIPVYDNPFHTEAIKYLSLKKQIKDDFFTTFYGAVSYILYAKGGNSDDFHEKWGDEEKVQQSVQKEMKKYSDEFWYELMEYAENTPLPCCFAKVFLHAGLVSQYVFEEIEVLNEGFRETKKWMLYRRPLDKQHVDLESDDVSIITDPDSSGPVEKTKDNTASSKKDKKTGKEVSFVSIIGGIALFSIAGGILYCYLKKYNPHLLTLLVYRTPPL